MCVTCRPVSDSENDDSCHPIYTMLLFCILDHTKGKRLPFSGIIPYAQAPEGFHFFFLLSETSMSTGLALRSVSLVLLLVDGELFDKQTRGLVGVIETMSQLPVCYWLFS